MFIEISYQIKSEIGWNEGDAGPNCTSNII